MIFNPTHRVKRLAGFGSIPDLTPIELVKTTEGAPAQLYSVASGRQFYLNNYDVEPLPQEEPMKLVPGNRYRWTVEGTVNKYGHLNLEDRGILVASTDVGFWELLADPLPTTPESVIRWKDHTYVLDGSRVWIGTEGRSVRGVSFEGATVLFDAGATRGDKE